MTTEIAKRSTTVPATEGSPSAYARFAAQRQAPNFVGQLLRFDGKQGRYHYGTEKKEMEEGTQFVAGMFTLKHGWVKWQEGKQVRQVMGLVEAQPGEEEFQPPPREALGDMDEDEWETMGEGRNAQRRDPWQDTCTIVLADPDTKDLFTFSTSSKGGRDALMALAGEFDEHRRQIPNEIPIVALKNTSYSNRTYGGTTFNPDFKIVGWIDRNEVSLSGESEEEETSGPAPRKVVAKVTPIKSAPVKKGGKSRF